MLTLLLRRSTGDELRKNLHVDVGKCLDVHATLPGLVLAERCEELFSVDRRILSIFRTMGPWFFKTIPPPGPSPRDAWNVA
jgi:hypothetical protein